MLVEGGNDGGRGGETMLVEGKTMLVEGGNNNNNRKLLYHAIL